MIQRSMACGRGSAAHLSNRLAGFLLTAAIVSSYGGAAYAQTTPFLPSREQVQPSVPEVVRRESQVRVDGNRAFRDVPCPFENETTTVTISRVRLLDGDGAPLAPELANLLAGIGGGQGPLRLVCDIRDRANTALRTAGYVASVQIPPQEINDGTLTLSVISAKLVEIRVEGRTGRYPSIIAARAERLKEISPFNQNKAERMLLIAGDVPGLDVQLSLSPAGTRPGEVIGTLYVDYAPYSAMANIQNYSSRNLGRETAFARVEAYGLTGLDDVTYVGGSSTFDRDEQQVLQLGHSMGIGHGGTRLEGNFTYSWSRPSLGFLDVRSRSVVAGLAVTYPLVRTANRNLNIAAGFDLIEQRTRFFGAPLNRDKLRVGYLRVDGNVSHPSNDGYGWSLSGSAEVRRGINIFDATQKFTIENDWYPSRLFGDPTASILRADLDAQIGLGSMFSMSHSLRTQYTRSTLLSYEEFSIGSMTIGRGYDPGANGGDSAIGLRSEIRANGYRGPKGSFETFAFIDNAWLWNNDPAGATFEVHRHLRSVGAGARLSLPGLVFVEAAWARPLDPATVFDWAPPPDRLLVSVTAQFSPR